MRRYSYLFSTIYDEERPVGQLGRGTHHSVLRAAHLPDAKFQDFAVIWDEDHDTRIIWIVEQLYVQGLLKKILFIGERKGAVTVITSGKPSPELVAATEQVSSGVPTDSFCAETHPFDPRIDSPIISDDPARVLNYLRGISALWDLGIKPLTFNTEPYGQDTVAMPSFVAPMT